MRDTAGSAAAPAARCKNVRRGSFISNPPSATSSFGHFVGAGRPPSAERSFLNGRVLSFDADAGLTDDGTPWGVVGLEDPIKPIRRNRHQLAADSLETLLEVGHGLREAGGVPVGANSPIQESISRPGTPDSVMVGTSGACGFR